LFIDGFDNTTCTSGCNVKETASGPMVYTKYTYGVALLESPFFLLANCIANLSHYSTNGRSLPYLWGIMLAAITYMLAGLYFISKLLRELQFDVKTQWLVPIGILLGTNLFFYTFRESGMSHVYSFFLIALLCYTSYRRVESPSFRWIILTSIPLALLILIRPTNAVAVLIPMLWGADPKELFDRIKNFLLDWRWLMIFLVSMGILILPQLMYWKMLTGEYVVYSYGDEGFTNWNQPKMFQVLFSHQNGWLIYSPLMIMPLVGLVYSGWNKMYNWMLPSVMLVLVTYIFGSWWAWWFGGAYGHRCFVEFLPLLAIPFAFAIERIRSWSRNAQKLVITVVVVAIFINLRMSDLYGGLWDGPDWTWVSYFSVLRNVFYLP